MLLLLETSESLVYVEVGRRRSPGILLLLAEVRLELHVHRLRKSAKVEAGLLLLLEVLAHLHWCAHLAEVLHEGASGHWRLGLALETSLVAASQFLLPVRKCTSFIVGATT